MGWRTIKKSPGYVGKRRAEFISKLNKKYGRNNWRIAWQWGKTVIPFETVCQIYEDAYWADSFRREKLWKELISKSKDVYDYDKSNIKSGLNYSIQEGPAIHIQDISIRRVVLRRGWRFKGKKLAQIRTKDPYWGQKLTPGAVPFHLPKLISNPHLKGWWARNSVEDFYQSNKILQKKIK